MQQQSVEVTARALEPGEPDYCEGAVESTATVRVPEDIAGLWEEALREAIAPHIEGAWQDARIRARFDALRPAPDGQPEPAGLLGYVPEPTPEVDPRAVRRWLAEVARVSRREARRVDAWIERPEETAAVVRRAMDKRARRAAKRLAEQARGGAQ